MTFFSCSIFCQSFPAQWESSRGVRPEIWSYDGLLLNSSIHGNQEAKAENHPTTSHHTVSPWPSLNHLILTWNCLYTFFKPPSEILWVKKVEMRMKKVRVAIYSFPLKLSCKCISMADWGRKGGWGQVVDVLFIEIGHWGEWFASSMCPLSPNSPLKWHRSCSQFSECQFP